MKEIPLTRGKVALVDDADFDRLMQWKWQALKIQKLKTYKVLWYAVRATRKGEFVTRKMILMHIQLLGKLPTGNWDHADGNGLNNQRNNLRIATYSQNAANRSNITTNATGFKGVSCCKDRPGSWVARLGMNGITRTLGRFDTPIAAAMAYDIAATQYFGEFAKTNASLGFI